MSINPNSIPAEERRILLVASMPKLKEIQQRLLLRSIVNISPLDWENRNPLKVFRRAWKVSSASWKALREGGPNAWDTFWKIIIEEELPAIHLSPEVAQRAFRFDVGHYPVDGTVYSQHPCFPDYYLLPAEFQVRVAREKVAAFKQLAAALGAKRMTLLTASTTDRRGFLGAKSSLQEAAAQIGMSATISASDSVSEQSYAEFDDPCRSPFIPEELSGWVAMDANFRTMAANRTNARQRIDRVSLEVRETAGITAEAAARLAGKGLELGGKYQKLAHSIWSYEIEYWPWEPSSLTKPA